MNKTSVVEIETMPDYWDCECKFAFIHPKDQEFCSFCGAHADEQPDSRGNEFDTVLRYEMRENGVRVFKGPHMISISQYDGGLLAVAFNHANDLKACAMRTVNSSLRVVRDNDNAKTLILCKFGVPTFTPDVLKPFGIDKVRPIDGRHFPESECTEGYIEVVLPEIGLIAKVITVEEYEPAENFSLSLSVTAIDDPDNRLIDVFFELDATVKSFI